MKLQQLTPIGIIVLFLLSSFGVGAQQPNKITIVPENPTEDFATHTVLGEYGTATWCGYCKYAHGALKALYKGGWDDFYYVSLVCDKNTHAYTRAITQLGLTGYPTVFWDGNYVKNVGAGSIPGAMTAYNTSLNTCGARTVANIAVSIFATWLGSATMSITVNVTNSQATTYNGYLRCYVTEIASSMGWFDTAGLPYTFPFLDYAFDQAISIPAGNTWSSTTTWNGALFNDGYGHTFAGITQNNTFLIASVFASSGGYVDETAGYRVGYNQPPNTPSNPSPSNGAINVKLTPTLSWQCSDPDWFDDLYYDVYFEKDDDTPDVLVSHDQTSTSYTTSTLELESTYYWQIVVRDEHGLTVEGPVWHFTTRGNQPPNTPHTPIPSDGATNVPTNTQLKWTGGDPDGDTVKYDVYFGTTSPPPKIVSNQSTTSYTPGALDFLTTYYWQIVAWDSFGATATGPIWEFTTSTAPNYEPDAPDISGPQQGKAGTAYDFTFVAIDPEDDDVYYYISWGDGTNEEWIGPYASGEEIIVSHTWTKRDTYNLKAKAKDIYDQESDWASMDVQMPKANNVLFTLLQSLLQRFPHAFPLLRYLLEV